MREFLAQIRGRAEERIKRELSGLGGLVKRPLYNSRMPLCVLVSTDHERYELVFMHDGDVELRESSSSRPDVTIESDTRTLERLLTNPDPAEFKLLESSSKIRITTASQKGREAESYIRRFLGL
jgi:hypothetical protein